MDATELKALDRKALRSMATELGVEWSKQTDDEKSLRKKIKAALAKAEEIEKPEVAGGTDFPLDERGPTMVVQNPRTGKPEVQFLRCFGWAFDADNEICKDCPHQKQCAPLSASSEKVLAKLQAKAEAEAVDEADAVEVENATKKVAEDKKKTQAKETEKKRSKKTEDDEDEDEGKSMSAPTARKGLSEKTKLICNYDMDWAEEHEDGDFRKFYKRALKRSGGKPISAGELLDIFADIVEVEDRDELLGDLIQTLLDNEDFKLAPK